MTTPRSVGLRGRGVAHTRQRRTQTGAAERMSRSTRPVVGLTDRASEAHEKLSPHRLVSSNHAVFFRSCRRVLRTMAALQQATGRVCGAGCVKARLSTAFDETIDRSRQSGRRTRPARSRRDLVQREGAVTSRPGPCVRTIGGPRTHARVASRQSRDYRLPCLLRPRASPDPAASTSRSQPAVPSRAQKERLRSSAKLSTRIAHRPCVSLLAPGLSQCHRSGVGAQRYRQLAPPNLECESHAEGLQILLKAASRVFATRQGERFTREWSHSRGEVRGASLAERRAAAPRARQPRSE